MSVPQFRDLYRDSREHFRKLGIDVDGKTQDGKQVSHYLASATLQGSIKGEHKSEERLAALALGVMHETEQHLKSQYGPVKKETTPYGSFGGISRGSVILTVKPGLWVAMEAPLSSAANAINMQVNSDETIQEPELTTLKENIKHFLYHTFEVGRDGFLDYAPRHNFHIHLDTLPTKEERWLDRIGLAYLLEN